jgi:DNA invertase Pin-like site-specific DNA recombinase
MKIAIYARVSTMDKGQDVDLQLSDLRTYAKARGWEIFKEYIDNGESGSKEQRPALNQLMDDARKRKVDTILVWRLDRFGRSLKHLILSLDEFKTLGVGFVSFKESLDFTTAAGRLMCQLLACFAEFERELIRERVVAGIRNAKAKGKHVGRPALDKEISRRVTELRNGGMSYGMIGKTLGLSKATVYKTYQNSI